MRKKRFNFTKEKAPDPKVELLNLGYRLAVPGLSQFAGANCDRKELVDGGRIVLGECDVCMSLKPNNPQPQPHSHPTPL